MPSMLATSCVTHKIHKWLGSHSAQEELHIQQAHSERISSKSPRESEVHQDLQMLFSRFSDILEHDIDGNKLSK